MDEHERDPRPEDRNQERGDDATKAEGGAATGALAGTAIGGPIGLAVGAAVGSIAGGGAEAADPSGARDEPAGPTEPFDRTAEPGTRRGYDMRDPRMGGHVGGSDPERE
jgi:hypothetical protein